MATRLTKETADVNGLKGEIVELALSLGVGQWAARTCPSCHGGVSKERSLSIDIQQNGIIKFFCHRAACEFSGNAYTSPGAASLGVKPQGEGVGKGRGERPLLEPVHPLSEREYAYFLSRYGIPQSAAESRIYRTDTRYALPILRPDGRRRGFITRRPYADSPADTAANRNDSQYAVKSLTYLEADEPCQSWYGASVPECVLIVEDPLSALRITSYWEHLEGESYPVSAVAILGTGVNADKLGEIQKVAKQATVYIALDKDATAQAFAMARKYGQAFAKCRVIVLERDIKDSTDDELAQLPI